MNAVALFIFLAGIVCLVIGYTQNQHTCPLPKIEYRYIPRTFYDEQLSVPKIGKQFYNMFNNESPWLNYPTNFKQYSAKDDDTNNMPKKKSINKDTMKNYFTTFQS
tara:strand:+ start:2124 stop:2441 length:318 start_codon:yes stop_codon:yes gene_type:complete